MDTITYKTALIVGAGVGLSAALTRLFVSKGIRVALAARQTDKLAALCKETRAVAYPCDATDPNDVTRLFTEVERDCGVPDDVVGGVGHPKDGIAPIEEPAVLPLDGEQP